MTLNPLKDLWLSNSQERTIETSLSAKDLRGFLETIALYRTQNSSDIAWDVASNLAASLKETLNSISPSLDDLLKIGFASIFLRDEERAIDCINRVKREIGFDYELTGAHVTRTRHQTKPCLILVAKVLKSQTPPTCCVSDVRSVPLEDEDLIEETAIHDTFVLGRLEASILLAEALLLKHFQPTNDSDTEKILALLNRIINDSNSEADFEIRICSLYLRSIIQSKMNPKYLERSCRQLEVLLELLTHRPDFDPTKCLFMPTRNELSLSLAENCCKQGQLSKALGIFRDLGLFDEQVACMLHLGMVEESKKLLEELIERECIDSTRWRRMCTLASLRKESNLLEVVWDQSKNKFSPAAKLLGQNYYSLGAWDKSCNWLNSYLELSPSDSSAWFLLGCSSMHLKQWDNAAQALLRTISSDPENAQAWNNLAAVYSQKQQNHEALEAFMQAGKFDYGNLKIWQNILAVAEPLKEQLAIDLAKKRISELTKNK